MANLVIWDFKSWHSVKKLRKNGKFGDLRFKKLAFRQRICEKMVNLMILDFKSWHSVKEIKEKWLFWLFEIQKVGIQTKNLWKMQWFEVKKWSLRFKKLDLIHKKAFWRSFPAKQCRQQLTFCQNPSKNVPRIIRTKFQLNRTINSKVRAKVSNMVSTKTVIRQPKSK